MAPPIASNPRNALFIVSHFDLVSDFDIRISDLTLHQLQFPCRGNLFSVDQFCPLIDKLRHDAHRNFGHTLRTDFDSYWAYDALQFFGRRNFFFFEVLEDCPRFAQAADHSDEQKWLMNPVLEDQRIVPMSARHNQRKAWDFRQRLRS